MRALPRFAVEFPGAGDEPTVVFGSLNIGDYHANRSNSTAGRIVRVPKRSRRGNGRRSGGKGGRSQGRRGAGMGRDPHLPVTTISTVGDAVVPQRLRRTMRWQYVINTLSAASVQSAYVSVALNGLYDPLFTLGGGSCTGFPQLMALYNRYIVSSTRLTARIRNSSSTSVGNDLVAYVLEIPAIQANMVGTIVSEDVLEARRCTTAVIPYNNAHQYRELSRTVSIVQLEALPSLLADYDDLSGTTNSNPTRTPIALVGITRPGGAQASSQAEMVLVVEFDTTFYQPTTFTVA